MSENKKSEPKPQNPTPQAQAQAPRVRFDTTGLKSSYANVCTMNSTREEVVLNFGINQAWERTQGELLIELSSRVILSPFAAQRLLEMLQRLMADYQARYGELKAEAPAPPQTPAPSAGAMN